MSMDARFVGKYELKEVLGRGGMAEVWQAFDTQLRREVAIKFLHPDLQNDSNFVARFEREAQAIASLRLSSRRFASGRRKPRACGARGL